MQSHHNGSFDAQCSGCQLAAEALLQGAFRRWEWFVKEVLVDAMCGLQPRLKNAVPIIPAPLYRTRIDARDVLLSAKYDHGTQTVKLSKRPSNFLLLHSPDQVIAVARFVCSNSSVESTFSQYRSDIVNLLKIRHGLAHGTRHAQQELRAVLIRFEPLNTYNTIGEFLLASSRARNSSWLETLLDEMTNWAANMSP